MINSLVQTIILKTTSWILLSNRLLNILLRVIGVGFHKIKKLEGRRGMEQRKEKELGEYGHALPIPVKWVEGDAGLGDGSPQHRTTNSQAFTECFFWQLPTQQP